MSGSRRMQINERSIVSAPPAAAPNATRPTEAGPTTGTVRRVHFAGIAPIGAANGWRASFMSV